MYIKSLIFSAFSNLLNTWVSRLKKFEDILISGISQECRDILQLQLRILSKVLITN